MKKKCKDCLVEKDTTCFYGVQGECKECTKNRVRKNYRDTIDVRTEYERKRNRYSIENILNKKYSAIRTRCTKSHVTQGVKKSVFGKDFLSKEEWNEWCNKKENYSHFMKIYNEWKGSNFERKLCPSIDRIDNKIGYISSNLQWLTLSQNCKKYNK